MEISHVSDRSSAATIAAIDGDHHRPPEGAAGVPLMLRVRIIDATTRAAVTGATLEVWHRDARGRGGSRSPRGAQVSDADGEVRFRTVFPGWSAGRAVHLHATVHAGGRPRQFFVDEQLTSAVVLLPPYRGNKIVRTTNAEDPRYDEACLLSVVPRDRYDLGAGLLAMITIVR